MGIGKETLSIWRFEMFEDIIGQTVDGGAVWSVYQWRTAKKDYRDHKRVFVLMAGGGDDNYSLYKRV